MTGNRVYWVDFNSIRRYIIRNTLTKAVKLVFVFGMETHSSSVFSLILVSTYLLIVAVER
jgi:hypothetical protein